MRLNGLRLLVVDDDADSLDFLAYALEIEGAEVIALACPHECLNTLKQIQPDVLISDLVMPEIDGYMLIRKIRAQEECKGIPAIAITAMSLEFCGDALLSEFQACLAKPIDLAQLVLSIAMLTGRSIN